MSGTLEPPKPHELPQPPSQTTPAPVAQQQQQQQQQRQPMQLDRYSGAPGEGAIPVDSNHGASAMDDLVDYDHAEGNMPGFGQEYSSQDPMFRL